MLLAQVVKELLEKYPAMAVAKNQADKLIDLNGPKSTGGTGIKQLRENIAESKLSYEIMDDAAQVENCLYLTLFLHLSFLFLNSTTKRILNLVAYAYACTKATSTSSYTFHSSHFLMPLCYSCHWLHAFLCWSLQTIQCEIITTYYIQFSLEEVPSIEQTWTWTFFFAFPKITIKSFRTLH